MAKQWFFSPLLLTCFLTIFLDAVSVSGQCPVTVDSWEGFTDVHDIGSVTLNGFSHTSDCNSVADGPGSVARRYSNYTNLGNYWAPTVGDPLHYSITLTSCWDLFRNGPCVAEDFKSRVGIYIDWDHNGNFYGADEVLYEGVSNGAGTISGVSFVPSFAIPGRCSLRVVSLSYSRLEYWEGACENYWYLDPIAPSLISCYPPDSRRTSGEIEDYFINVTVPGACAGLPPAGQTKTSQNNVCPTDYFTLYVDNVVLKTGYTFQWQQSLDGFNYENIPGATGHLLGRRQGGNTYYRRITTCTASGQYNYSASLLVTNKLFTSCYCFAQQPSLDVPGDIVRVTLGDATQTSTCNANTIYTSFKHLGAMTAIRPGQTLPFTVTGSRCDGNNGLAYNLIIFADFNLNGTFDDAGELLYRSNPAYSDGDHTFTGAVTIPPSAQPGVTCIRVIYSANMASNIGACAFTDGGEQEDYLIEVLECLDAGSGGQIDSIAVCANDTFSLRVRCATDYYDNRYEWYVSDDGSYWEPVAGAKDATFRGVQTTSKYYRRKTTRISTGGFSLSNAVHIGMKPFYHCYCSALPSNSTNPTVQWVTVNGAGAFNRQISSCNVLNPENYGQTPFIVLNLDEEYSFDVNGNYCYQSGDAVRFRIKLDLNRNGVYEPNETIYNGSRFNLPKRFRIPFNAQLGLTGMRVQASQLITEPANCADEIGEAENYVVYIAGCSGQPVGGTTTVQPGPFVCPGDSISLRVINDSPPEQQLNYQWQVNTGTWRDIPNATGATLDINYNYNFNGVAYRRRSTCARKMAVAYSQEVTMFIKQSDLCYCTSSANSAAGMDIAGLAFHNVLKLNDCNEVGGGTNSVQNRYSDYRPVYGVLDSVNLGETVQFRVGIKSCDADQFSRTGVFIDLNRNGSFFDPGEALSDPNAVRWGEHEVAGSFVVPMNAAIGTTTLRVVNTSDVQTQNPVSPCGTYPVGETEDYLIKIMGCTGTPEPGVTQASVTSFCSLAPDVVFSVTGDSPPQAGLVYQWQAAPDGNTWDNIPGATQATCTSNVTTSYYFRRKMTCTSSGSEAYSVPVFVEKNPFACYCNSAAGSAEGADISSVGVNGDVHTQGCNATGGPGSLPGRYTNNKNLDPIFKLRLGQTNQFFISVGPCDNNTTNTGWAVFIDYNRNGNFNDPGEMVTSSGGGLGGNYGQTTLFDVPDNIPEGVAAMRVIAADMPGNTISACGSYTIGETVDYLIELEDPCSGNIVYVDQDATGANIGKSWTHAFTDLQTALAWASECPNVTEIWVAEGTYLPANDNDRSSSFALKNGLTLYGGFAGTETALSQRDFKLHPTLLSGNIGNPDDPADNSWHVVTSTDNNNTAVLDGFVVRDGYANEITRNYGGGFWGSHSSAVIRNSVFRNNKVRFASSTDYGPAMYLAACSSQIENCTFFDNFPQTSADKGSIYLRDPGNVTFTNCLITGNGGGIFTSNGAAISLVNCTVTRNNVMGIATLNSPIHVVNSIIHSNPVTVLAGAAPVITHSITPEVYAGAGNMTVNPLFVNPDDPDGADNVFGTSDDGFQLQGCSPAIDTGMDASNSTFLALGGDIRKFEAIPGGQKIDLGAYEYAETAPLLTAKCKPFLANLDATGSITVPASAIDNNSAVSCLAGLSINGQSSIIYTCSDLGAHTVTLVVSSPQNNRSTTCQATVVVADNLPPAITCPDNTTIAAGSYCLASIGAYTSVSKSDNCTASGSLTEVQSPVAATTLSGHDASQTVTLTASDGNGNTQSCTFTVTLKDASPPTLTCPASVSKNADADQCTAVHYYTLTAQDNCSGWSAQRLGGLSSGAAFPIGATVVEWKVTDSAVPANATTCSFTVTVVDAQPPGITCPASISKNTDSGQCTAVVNYSTPTYSDNCAGATLLLLSPMGSGSTFPKGVHTVLWKATDAAANTATCSFTITVEDAQPPSITCPVSISRNTDPGQCTAVVSYSAPAFSDNCAGAAILRIGGLQSGSAFPKGINMVQWKATDAAGLSSVCQFTVTVMDAQPPTITCPANIVKGTDAGQCTAVVTYNNPLYTDNCTGAGLDHISGGLSGSTFLKGSTTVVWQATDAANLTQRCTFTITVNDTQTPAITCPGNQTKSTDANLCTAVTNYPTPTFTDNCAGGNVTIQSGLASGSAFPKGINTVTWRATDAAGLTKTCTFRVTVNDPQAPAITCPANQAKTTDANLCTAISTYNLATFTDNCSGGLVVKLSGLNSGSAFPKGVNNVVFKATDASGNQSLCTMTVTVTDAQLPTVVCPANIVVTGSISDGVCSATVTYTNPAATDNCGILSSFLWSGLASGAVFPEGVTTNTWKATDDGGLTATCIFTVTVNCGTSPETVNDERETMNEQREDHSLSYEQSRDLTTLSRPVSGSNLALSLAPNPAAADVLITIDGLDESEGQLSIFDAAGRVVWQSTVNGQQTTVNLTNFASGLYQVRLRTAHGVVTKALVVSKL